MKAEELMIGDWVNYKGIFNRVAPADFDYNHSKWMKEIKPIPLTPEILEKNGFYYGYTSNEYDLASNTIAQLSPEDEGWVWDEGAGSVKVIFPNEADGGIITIDDQGFDRYLTLVFSVEICVHELQHVLKLCRINKKIVV